MLPVLWVASAAVIATAAVRSRHHPGSLRTGRFGVAFLYLAAGAAVNAFFLARGDDYAEFAKGSYLPFVRDTWESVVVPDHDIWIGLLIAFELGVGVLALVGGRPTQLAYAAAITFHVALLSFGLGFFLWSIPMIAALTTLLRVERRTARLRTRRLARKPLSPSPVRAHVGSARELQSVSHGTTTDSAGSKPIQR